MKIITAGIFEVQEGQELAEDLIVDGCKLLSKGRKLTTQIIKILKNRKISSLEIVQWEADEVEEEVISIDELEIDLNYLDSLSSLNIETRYGWAAQNEAMLNEVFEIYNELEANPEIQQFLQQLKKFDTYTFLHSLDVFTIGTLFAKHLKMPMMKVIALGYLLHDVGKLSIPNDVLNKPGKLTRQEFDLVKAHTTEGELLLRKAGLDQVAYFAALHHERHDGSGYPNGLKGSMLSAEIELLHIIDTYSALTLRRSYRNDKNAADAMVIMCKDRHLFNEELLYNFINFIGIYPEGAKVLLTDGQEVAIARTTPNFPLLPQVRSEVTGQLFMMPTDFQVRIDRILSFEPDTKEQMCNKLFDFLLAGNDQSMLEYYNELSEQYQPHDFYLRVIIPVYKSLKILQEHSLIKPEIFESATRKLKLQIRQTNRDLGIINKREQTFILVLPRHYTVSLEVLILEGVLHSDGIYPVTIHDAENKAVLKALSETHGVSGMIIFDNVALQVEFYETEYQKYDMTEAELEELIGHFCGSKSADFDVMKQLARYGREELAAM